jgi:hypothetical protein
LAFMVGAFRSGWVDTACGTANEPIAAARKERRLVFMVGCAFLLWLQAAQYAVFLAAGCPALQRAKV